MSNSNVTVTLMQRSYPVTQLPSLPHCDTQESEATKLSEISAGPWPDLSMGFIVSDHGRRERRERLGRCGFQARFGRCYSAFSEQ